MKIKWRYLLLVLAALFVGGCDSLRETQAPSETKYGQNLDAGGFISVAGAKLYFESYGAGKPLLLLHGNDQSIHVFRKQIAYFRHKRLVIALDSRGHGKSTLGTDNLSYDLMAEDVAALLRQMNLGALDIIGWSDGGNIGLLLAIRHPDLVRKLVVMGAALSPDGAHDWAFPRVRSMKSDAETKIAAGDTSEEVFAQLQKADLLLYQPKIATKALAAITSPVLVVVGDEDVIKHEHTLAIYSALENAHLNIMPGATHFAPWSHSTLFNTAAEHFLDEEFIRPTTRAILGE